MPHGNDICVVISELSDSVESTAVGSSFHSLIHSLRSNGRANTVVYVEASTHGKPASFRLAGEYAQDNFVRVPSIAASLDAMPHSDAHQAARRVYHWLRDQRFHSVFFINCQRLAAVCTQAKRAGAAFLATRLIVVAHEPGEYIRESAQQFPATGRETLIDDALERAAIALADIVVSPTRHLIDWMRCRGWRLPNDVRYAPCLPATPARPGRALASGELREVIFFGALGTQTGLEVFLGAIEQTAEHFAGLSVTLLGDYHPKLSDVPAALLENFSRRRAGRFTLKPVTGLDYCAALEYISNRTGGLVVIPWLVSDLSQAVIDCLALGVPFLTSNRGGVDELIGSPEHLVEPTSAALAARLLTVLKEGLPQVRSQYSPIDAYEAWRPILELPPTAGPIRQIDTPRISVCIPHFEQTTKLRTTLTALLRQTHRAEEVIVVDDGSSSTRDQATLAALETEFRPHGIRFLRQANAGPAAARNTAARAATGDALVFCDADNRPYPHMLEALGRALTVSGAPIATCAFRAVRADDDPEAKTDRGYLFCPLSEPGGLELLENVLGDTNFIVDRKLFLELGGFNPANRSASEDWEFLLRASLAGHGRAVVPDPLFDYVISRQSHARSNPAIASARAALAALPADERTRYERVLLATRGMFEQQGINVSHRIAALEGEIRSLHQSLFHSAQQKEEFARELTQERGGLQESTLRLHEALQRAHIAEGRLARTKGSISWRLTSPLRALRRLLGARTTSHPEASSPPAVSFVYFIEPPSSWKAAPSAGTLTGWILQPDHTPVAAVRGHVLGRCYPARYYLPRPDVAEIHGEAATFCGLTFDYEIPPGEEHPIVLEALLPDGRWQRFFEQMVKAAPSGRGGVDYGKWLAARAGQAPPPPAPESGPTVSILVPVYNTPEQWLRRAVASVKAQTYARWQLCLADDASAAEHIPALLDELAASDNRILVKRRAINGHICAASNTALEAATGEWIALLDHDDELAPHALARLAHAIAADPDAKFIYSDEDKIDEDGRRFDPYFKPDWNPDLLRGQNYCCHLSAFRTALVHEVGGFRAGTEGSQDWDLVLRVTDRLQPSEIVHIPEVLYHWRAIKGSTALALGEKNYTQQAARRTLEDHLARTGVLADLIPVEGGHWRIRYLLPAQPPLVSLIIPTHNGEKLVRQCIESLRTRTSYPRYEIILVNNRSEHPESLAYFRQLAAEGVRVIDYDAPFNFSAINNFAVRHAQGSVLGFLNNDLEAVHADWLDEMVSQALRPEIGAVGAMLHYPDGGIQHAGIVLGIAGPMRVGGVAGHAFKGFPRGSDGYFNRLRLAQNYSAVTAACLVIRRDIFEQVGGFNEADLPVAFNDVDFCLRVRAAGYRNLWTPFAELYHHESASRGADDTPDKKARFKTEIDYMRRTWGALLDDDPAYNPNLTLIDEDFSLSWPPREVRGVT